MAMVLRSDSSSSMASADQSCFTYDVFLSFRGETRKNFTDHLYKALKQVGIRTFRDDDAMDRGKILGPELEKAIRQSKISIIVFSRNYASSKWCLEEVLTIIKEQEQVSSQHEVVPVFYNVEPSDVRNQTGSFEESFRKYDKIIKAERDHQKRKKYMDKVKEWRGSLRKAANLTGMVLADGHEAEFINKIVNVIRKKLDYKALYIEDKLVGIEDDVSEIELWLQHPSHEAAILLIDGIGGVGKTTIAKCVYNSNRREYESSCFLADISQASNQFNGLLRLQSQLLSTIYKSEKEETIWNVDEGTVKVTDALRNTKVLLILDNVTTTGQLDALLGRQKLYPGSKVIITTRHKWPLYAFKVHHKVHTINELGFGDSMQLFSLYAFSQDFPIEPYLVQSERVVRYCGGLPLALKVLGSSLHGNENDVWEDTIRQLEANPDSEIQKTLQISYETLRNDNDKDVFLHVACFFVGEKKDYIVTLLAQCDLYPVVGIKNLQDRCLLYFDEFGRVMMHQLIKEMGREVVRQESPKDPGERSRLWHPEDCFNVLQDNSGTKTVEGLVFNMHMIKERQSNFEIGTLEEMKNLMLLQLDYVTFSGECKKLPRKLRLLSWHGFSLKAIPSDIPLEKLVVLDMSYSKLKLVWDHFKVIRSLKILNLSFCVELIETPDFGGLPGLESLILKGCSSLTEVHNSISCLEGLALLDLTDCTSLGDIPCLPSSLVSLKMSGCPNLGYLEMVQCLDSVSSFSFLKNMNISHCNLFDNSFPNDWSTLVSLEMLWINGNNVTSLPNCIQTLPYLTSLSAENCSLIQSIEVPKSISFLYITGNHSLESVQLVESSRTAVRDYDCPKLSDSERGYKVLSIDDVDRKVIRYLGLESVAVKGMELDLWVLYEYGIFSIYVSAEQIPSCFTYKERGPQITFKVPSHPNKSKISGINMCVVLSESGAYYYWIAKIYNKTKKLLWKYIFGSRGFRRYEEKHAWLSLWRCGNLLEGGDEILIRIIDYLGGEEEKLAEECYINLIYEDDEEVDDEEVDGKEVDEFDPFYQISWTDHRLPLEISDYVHNGKTYEFETHNWYSRSFKLEDSGDYIPP